MVIVEALRVRRAAKCSAQKQQRAAPDRCDRGNVSSTPDEPRFGLLGRHHFGTASKRAKQPFRHILAALNSQLAIDDPTISIFDVRGIRFDAG